MKKPVTVIAIASVAVLSIIASSILPAQGVFEVNPIVPQGSLLQAFEFKINSHDPASSPEDQAMAFQDIRFYHDLVADTSFLGSEHQQRAANLMAIATGILDAGIVTSDKFVHTQTLDDFEAKIMSFHIQLPLAQQHQILDDIQMLSDTLREFEMATPELNERRVILVGVADIILLEGATEPQIPIIMTNDEGIEILSVDGSDGPKTMKFSTQYWDCDGPKPNWLNIPALNNVTCIEK